MAPSQTNNHRRGHSISGIQAQRNHRHDPWPTVVDGDLPIMDVLDDIVQSLRQRPNLLLEAPPGAGKTTVVPLALLRALIRQEEEESLSSLSSLDQKHGSNPAPCQIWVVQPRRVAVRATARRLAQLWGDAVVGHTVGYPVGYLLRGETRVSSHTRLVVVTDGVLLQRLRTDPTLSGISTVVLDEFHERGVAVDTALALCRLAQSTWRDATDDPLRIIVMSATLWGGTRESDNNSTKNNSNKNNNNPIFDKLYQALGGPEALCSVVQSRGRQYPIDIQWADEWWKKTGTQPLSPLTRSRPPLSRLRRDRAALTDAVCRAVHYAVRLPPLVATDKDTTEDDNGNDNDKGDILVFLPGAAEIRRVVGQLQRQLSSSCWEVLPLYGALPRTAQDRALTPGPTRVENNYTNHRRRIIVASPIAEASLTIPDVTCVVDAGLRRQASCDADTGLPRLITTTCSRASATQRAGRAGRVQPGRCIRLYTVYEYGNDGGDDNGSLFVDQTPPEILQTDLASTVLLLASWGCTTVQEVFTDLPFVDPPPVESIQRAVQLLVDLGCLEDCVTDAGIDASSRDRLVLTSLGQDVAATPGHPRLTTTLVRARDDLVRLVGAVAVGFLLDDETSRSFISSRPSPDLAERVRDLYQPQPKSARTSMVKPLLTYATRVGKEARVAVHAALHGDFALSDIVQNLGPAVLPGFVDLVAERKGDASYGGSTYLLSLGRSARLDDIQDAALKYIIVLETSTGDDGKTRIRSFVSVQESDLQAVAVEKDTVFAVSSRGYEVRARRVRKVGSLELSSTPLPAPTFDQVASVLRRMIRDNGGAYILLTQTMPAAKRKRLDTLLARLELAQHVSLLEGEEEEWPSWITNTNDLDSLLDPWMTGGIRSLKDLDLLTIVESSLSPSLMATVESSYPERIAAPDGSQIPLLYQKQQTVKAKEDNVASSTWPVTVMAKAKLQQFFGVIETPTVGPRSHPIPIQLQLLSPSQKLLAQTRDLPFFWDNVYPQVRAEMRGKYPKHPWPEDPLTAVATRQTNQQIRRHQSSAEVDSNGSKDISKPSRRKKKKRKNR